MLRNSLPILILAAALTGCATTPPLPPDTSTQSSEPVFAPPPQSSQPTPAIIPPVVTPKPTQPAIKVNNYRDPRAGRVLLDRLLPRGIPARKGWNDAIFTAFTQLKIPYTAQYFCAVMCYWKITY